MTDGVHTENTGRSTAQEIPELWVDTGDMMIRLPQRKLEDLRQRLANWPTERREVTIRDVLSLAGKMHHGAYVVRPGRYFFHRRLRLANLHRTGEKLRGGGDEWGRHQRKEEAEGRLYLTPELMADVGWWRWFVNENRRKTGERLRVPFVLFGKQEPSKRWFSDASYQAVGGYCLETC